MAEPMAQAGAPTQAKAAIVCRLRPRIPRWGPSPTAGEVELENVSEDVVEIEVFMHPLQYLNLIVVDSTGAPVPSHHYGELFSPREKSYFLRLGPGEKYTHPVSLLGNVAQEKRLPGTYTVRAVYEYNGLRALSEPLEVRLPAGDG
jgi:hypothetical protein